MIPNQSTLITSSAPDDSQPFVAYTRFPRLERWLEEQLRKLPTLPKSWPPVTARVAPWAWLACLPLQIFALLAQLGVVAIGAMFGSLELVGLLLGVATFACYAVALPGLFKRTQVGWSFALYGALLQTLDSLLSLSLLGMATSVLVLWLAVAAKGEYGRDLGRT